jgi:exopolyphosphatase/pppGpp-phosphohydrolase
MTSIGEMLKYQQLHAVGTHVYTSIHKKMHIGHLTYLTLHSGMYGFTIQQSVHI